MEPFDLDHKDFPTAGEIKDRQKRELEALLDALPRPLRWADVDKALGGAKWIAHATFDTPTYQSNTVGDYIIRRMPDEWGAGYRTYPGGADPGPEYVRSGEVA